MQVIPLASVALSRVRRQLQAAAAARDLVWLEELDVLIRVQLERAFNDCGADEAYLARELRTILRVYAELAERSIPPRSYRNR